MNVALNTSQTTPLQKKKKSKKNQALVGGESKRERGTQKKKREREGGGEEKVLNVTRETKNVSARMAVDTHPVKGDDCEGFGHAEAAMETD